MQSSVRYFVPNTVVIVYDGYDVYDGRFIFQTASL